MTGLVVVTLPGFVRSDRLEQEAARLKLVLEMAVEESQIQSSELAIQPDRNRYAFYIYDELAQQWYEMNSPPLSTHDLDDNINLSFSIESKPFTFSIDSNIGLDDEDDVDESSKGKKKPPPILFLSSGETTVFTLTLASASGDSRTLESDGFGSFRWLGTGDESIR